MRLFVQGSDPARKELVKRKLGAILSADVKGYSRLIGEEKLRTVRTLEAYREMIAEVIRNCSGRVVDSPENNVLAEFASVVDAATPFCSPRDCAGIIGDQKVLKLVRWFTRETLMMVTAM